MNKRALGNALTTIGSPAMLGVVGFVGAFHGGNKNPLPQLAWAIPLALVSLPLLPLYMKGESILAECDTDDFRERTSKLPKIAHLPEDHIYIEEFEGEYFINPLYFTEGEAPFKTLEEARTYISNLGYEEVVCTRSFEADHPWEKMALMTIWIKPDKEI